MQKKISTAAVVAVLIAFLGFLGSPAVLALLPAKAAAILSMAGMLLQLVAPALVHTPLPSPGPFIPGGPDAPAVPTSDPAYLAAGGGVAPESAPHIPNTGI
jgi:hypothetical protein